MLSAAFFDTKHDCNSNVADCSTDFGEGWRLSVDRGCIVMVRVVNNPTTGAMRRSTDGWRGDSVDSNGGGKSTIVASVRVPAPKQGGGALHVLLDRLYHTQGKGCSRFNSTHIPL